MEFETGERCSHCGEARMVLDSIYGVLACDSCGRVGNQVETELRAEWQVGHVIERRGTHVSEYDSGAAAAKGLMRGQVSHNFYTGYTSWSERHKVETMKKVERITASLRVPGDKVERVKHIVETTLEGDWGSGRWVDIMVAACIYIVIRQSQLPLTVPEVADCVNCDVVELGRMFNRCLHKLDISMPQVDLCIFLERSASTLPALSRQSKDVVREVKRQASILLNHAEQWFITTGRRPLPVVAAVLQLVLESNKVSAKIVDVARELHAGIWATRLRYNECKNALVVVAQKLPWGTDVTPKNVLRHLPFLLQYLELEMKLKERHRQNGTNNNPSSSGEGTHVRASTSHAFKAGEGMVSKGYREKKATDHETSYCAADEVPEGRPTKYLKINGGHSLLRGNKALVEVKVDNEEEPSLGNNSPMHGAELKASVKSGKEILEGLSELTSLSPTPKDTLSEEHRPWEVLPVAYVASQQARARRLHKIHVAKTRISKARSSLSDKLQNSANVSVPGVESKEHLQPELKSVDNVCICLDEEDLRIQRLLLYGANGVELENGYYKALEAQLPLEEGDEADDLVGYIHTKSEVEVLAELKKQKEDGGMANPDLLVAALPPS